MRNDSSGRARLLYLDNLRSTVIVLVVSMHAADTYSPLGNWYYKDHLALTRGELLFFAAWQTYLQAFFMGLLFFIAGYFVPPAFARKGAWLFLRERAFRLGLPVLFYMFVLGPFTEYFIAGSWTSEEHTTFVNEWLEHIRNGQFLSENGPLWFCLALLIFSCVYASIVSTRAGGNWIRPRTGAELTTFGVTNFALAMAALAFALRLVWPHGLVFLNMHLTDFAQYVLLFVAGVMFSERRVLAGSFPPALRSWILWIVAAGFVVWLVLVLGGGALEGNTSAYQGGWHWQAAGWAVWESFTCVAISLGGIKLYRFAFDAQQRAGRYMSANAFSVYIFHPPIVIAFARWLHTVELTALIKFALLTILATLTSLAVSSAVLRRIPLLRTIL